MKNKQRFSVAFTSFYDFVAIAIIRVVNRIIND